MKKSRVLLVEDDHNISKLITDYLAQFGYTVTAMVDGPDAIEHVREEGFPHIVLIDLTLPTMHGFELAHKIKSMADVPIIFVTSTSDTETIVQGLKNMPKTSSSSRSNHANLKPASRWCWQGCPALIMPANP